MTSEVESLIQRYLRDLETGLRGLPAGSRRQFIDEVRGRIDRARIFQRPWRSSADWVRRWHGR